MIVQPLPSTNSRKKFFIRSIGPVVLLAKIRPKLDFRLLILVQQHATAAVNNYNQHLFSCLQVALKKYNAKPCMTGRDLQIVPVRVG